MNYDLEKMQKAIIYVSRLANGYNPRTNKLLESQELANDPSFIRCMYFIKELLVKINEGKTIKNNKTIKLQPKFPYEVLKEFQYKADKTITAFVNQLNELVLSKYSNFQKIKYTKILKWLKNNNYLSSKYSDELEKNVTIITEKGEKIGIYSEIRQGANEKYLVIIYSKEAQEFIINNLERILNEL